MILNPQMDHTQSEVRPAYYTGMHRYSFRAGESALIVGVVFVRNAPDHRFRPCFHIRYANGDNDYVVMDDGKNGELTYEPYPSGSLKDRLL